MCGLRSLPLREKLHAVVDGNEAAMTVEFLLIGEVRPFCLAVLFGRADFRLAVRDAEIVEVPPVVPEGEGTAADAEGAGGMQNFLTDLFVMLDLAEARLDAVIEWSFSFHDFDMVV